MAILSLHCTYSWGGDVKVLTSIKPLQLIAGAITQGVTEVEALLPTHVDPHQYALKPSDLLQLDRSELFVWVGPQFETYLEKPLASYGYEKPLISMDQNTGVPAPHAWLSPKKARRLGQQIYKELVRLDPKNNLRYERNLQDFNKEIQALTKQFEEWLKPVRNKNFLVYHNAYESLIAEYQVQPVGVIREYEATRPGAAHLMKLRSEVAKKGISCIIVPPGPTPREVRLLGEPRSFFIQAIDPLAIDIAIGKQAYFVFMRELMRRWVECLGTTVH